MDTTDDEKLRILTMRECGKSTKEIAKAIQKSARTVQRWLLHHRNKGNMQKKSRGKRPRKTTHEEDVRLVQFAHENPDLTQKEIITICNVNIYKSTLRRRLQEARTGGLDLDFYKKDKERGEKSEENVDLLPEAKQVEEIITFVVDPPEKTKEMRTKLSFKERRAIWEKNGKDTTDIEKSKILIMNECGMTTSQIAKSLNKSRRTIQRWLAKHSRGLSMEKRERGKRPRKTTPEEDERIIEFVKANPHLSRKEVLEQCDVQLHKVTLKNRLNEAGIFFNSQGVKILDYSAQTEESRPADAQQAAMQKVYAEIVSSDEFAGAKQEGQQVLAFDAPMLVYQTTGQTQTIHYQLLY